MQAIWAQVQGHMRHITDHLWMASSLSRYDMLNLSVCQLVKLNSGIKYWIPFLYPKLFVLIDICMASNATSLRSLVVAKLQLWIFIWGPKSTTYFPPWLEHKTTAVWEVWEVPATSELCRRISKISQVTLVVAVGPEGCSPDSSFSALTLLVGSFDP